MKRWIVAAGMSLMLAGSGGARTACAQWSGVVRDSTSGMPIPGAVVILLTPDRESLARGLTSAAGVFRLPAAPGVVTLRVIRIGFRPSERPLDQLRDPIVVDLVPLSRTIQRVAVRVNPVCPRRADQREALELWSAATDALLAIVVAEAESTQTGTVTQLLFNRLMEPGGRRVVRQSSRRVITGNVVPIRADRTAEEFARRGYVEDRVVMTTYYSPDPAVLLDSTFAATHCLSLRTDERGHPGQAGVAFAPPRDRRVPDIAGVLWLDRDPLELRSMDFEYRGVDQAVIDMRAGGRLEFETLSNGVPTITSWLVRSPRLLYLPAGTYRGRSVREGELASVHEIYETGGVIASGFLSDGTVWSADLATLGGRVTAARSGDPVAGAVITLDSTDQRSVTDSTGSFAFDELMPGPHRIRVRDSIAIGVRLADSANVVLPDSSLQQWVTRVLTRDLDVRGTGAPPVELRVPWQDQVAGCGTPDRDRYFVVGVVMTLDSVPVPNAAVRLSWADTSRSGTLETHMDARANAAGAFFLCGIPAERLLSTVILVPDGAEHLGTTAVSRIDLDEDGRPRESSVRSLLLTISPPGTSRTP